MKQETIQGSCDSKGLFKAKNPYTKFGTGNPQDYLHAEFSDAHPELLCYTPSNELVTDVENVVIGPVYRYKNTGQWCGCRDKEQYTELAMNGYEVMTCYIAVPPTELTEAKPFNAIDEAQPLERVKTAECNLCQGVGTVMFGKTWNYCTCSKGIELKQTGQSPPISKEVRSAEEILDAAVEFGQLDIKDNDYANIVDAMETYHKSKCTTNVIRLFLYCVNNSDDEGHFFQKMQDCDLIQLAQNAITKSK